MLAYNILGNVFVEIVIINIIKQQIVIQNVVKIIPKYAEDHGPIQFFLPNGQI